MHTLIHIQIRRLRIKAISKQKFIDELKMKKDNKPCQIGQFVFFYIKTRQRRGQTVKNLKQMSLGYNGINLIIRV